jgi:dTDP-4-amino-4,6-dideoxygalactose transaminase
MSSSLALLGGEPAIPGGPPAWPVDDPAVADALARACRDGSWGKYDGGHVSRLEDRLAGMFGQSHVLACGSGTFAVELALRAVQVQPGDEVVLAAYDYPGNFLSVHALGAQPVLVDLEPGNWNLAPANLTEAFRSKPRALIASHLHGGLVPMHEVMEIAHEHQVAVIEDAAQAPGARIDGQPAGSWGDVSVLSFGGSKLLSAGRGGAILTRRPEIHQRARRFQNRGNLVCPLSELQAVVLGPQLDRLAERTQRRADAVAYLSWHLARIPGVRLFQNKVAGQPAYYKVGFQLDEQAFGLSRTLLTKAMRAEGVALDEGFASLHVGRSPRRFRAAGAMTEADRAHGGCVILHHPVLLGGEAALEKVVHAFNKVHAGRADLLHFLAS